MILRPVVLLVEDNDDLRLIFKSALTLNGFKVQEAPGGLEALQYLETNRPDVVVLDLIMPGINGFDVRSELRVRPHLQHVPVVIVTAVPPEDLPRFDAQCILRKPIMPADLATAVRRCLVARSAR
jgi:CheY-like chemotaxis protein